MYVYDILIVSPLNSFTFSYNVQWKKKEANRADLSWSVISYVIEVSALAGTIKYDSRSLYFENSL